MYAQFYGLQEKPFELSPTPKFLYLGESHREALAVLTYGVVERKGLVLLTGDVGAGKTTIVRALLENLQSSTATFYLSNPILTASELFDYLGSTLLKKKIHYNSKADFLLEFDGFLESCREEEKAFVLIIDDAQRLSDELLEELRLLLNSDLSDYGCLNLILVGQPELSERLNQPQCRSLLHRIGLRYHIPPLSYDETEAYLTSRLEVAGAEDKRGILASEAIKALHTYSKGNPRLINILADNAMLLGYSQGKKKINAQMVIECYRELRVQETAEGAPLAEPEPPSETATSSSRWKVFFLAGLIFLIPISWFFSQRSPQLLTALHPSWGGLDRSVTGGSAEVRMPISRALEPQHSGGSDETPAKTEQAAGHPSGAGTPNGQETTARDKTPVQIADVETTLGSDSPPAEAKQQPSSELPPIQDRSLPISADESPSQSGETAEAVVLQEDQTLIRLAVESYGRVDQDVLELLKRHNPSPESSAKLKAGDRVVVPELPATQQAGFTVHIASYKPFSYAENLFSTLASQGSDPHISIARDTPIGEVYRVTLGQFETSAEAAEYAADLLEKRLFSYAQVIPQRP